MFSIVLLKFLFKNCNCTDQINLKNFEDNQSTDFPDHNFENALYAHKYISNGKKLFAAISESEDSVNTIPFDANLFDLYRDFDLSHDSQMKEGILPDILDSNDIINQAHMISSIVESSFPGTRQHNFMESKGFTEYEDQTSLEVQDLKKMCSFDYSIQTYAPLPEDFLDDTEITESNPPSSKMPRTDKQDSICLPVSIVSETSPQKLKGISSKSSMQKQKLQDSDTNISFSRHLQPVVREISSIPSLNKPFSYEEAGSSDTPDHSEFENYMTVEQLNENFKGLKKDSLLTGEKYKHQIRIFCEVMKRDLFQINYAHELDLTFDESLNTNRLSYNTSKKQIELDEIADLQPLQNHIVILGHYLGYKHRNQIVCAFQIPEKIGSTNQFKNFPKKQDLMINSGIVYRLVFMTLYLNKLEKIQIHHDKSSDRAKTETVTTTRCCFTLKFSDAECPLKETVLVLHHGQILYLKCFKLIQKQAKFTIHSIDEDTCRILSIKK
ncbi:hypothetical protein M153_3290001031 [Pseudoloma neurophilia]|uniref:Uncharacterized protein n=1 Tax=Pseudoloma neurophilia TaxID=146866 RepID=A0A0R0M542_9MICR|nr:hypothetical protein M153_3290001031 [Pseudoloma neurophilia]